LRLALLLVEAVETWGRQSAEEIDANNAIVSDKASQPDEKEAEDH
jgi:hypothetical protein